MVSKIRERGNGEGGGVQMRKFCNFFEKCVNIFHCDKFEPGQGDLKREGTAMKNHQIDFAVF